MIYEEKIFNSVEEIKDLIKTQLTLELYKSGISQKEIAKKLHIAKKTVNDILKGIKTIKG